jgi:hypothetical protein
MEDNSVFNTAADFVNNTQCHIFLTGKAGTGKTTFLKYIKNSTPKKCVVVAPTGVAAINAGGVTMHSFFQLPLGPYVPVTQKFSQANFTDKHTLFKNIRFSEEKRELIRDLQLIIIDEVSMVRSDALDAIDAILRYFRKKPDVVFGGVQLLFIGDMFQLPPVMPDAEWSVLKEYYASPFFFHSKAIEQSPPIFIELKKIYRQNEQHFIRLLNSVRNAETNAADLENLNARYGIAPEPERNYITLTTHNYKADKINADELAKLPGKLYEFKGSVEGDFSDKILPTDVALQLKVNAQVMFIRNDKSDERKYFNGKIATIKKIEGDSIWVTLAESEEELQLEKETWNNIRYSYNQEEEKIEEEKLGSFTQYPVRLAWAITIHKSQGLTFERAIIDAGDSFAPGQVYVALSRCTSLEGLILHSKIFSKSISTDERILTFSKKETEAQELVARLQAEKRVFLNSLLLEVFDLSKTIETLEHYVAYIPGKKIPDLKGAQLNALKTVDRARENQKVAIKFKDQLEALLKENAEDKLKERVTKAIDYFTKALVDEVLTPLDQHIDSLKGVTKVRKYLKRVKTVRNEVARKIKEIQTARYGDVVFEPSKVMASLQAIESHDRAKKGKPEKGESLKETLELFKRGLTLQDISKQRSLAFSTIEGHIAMLIKAGELDILQIMNEEKLSRIVAAIKETQGTSLTPIKVKLGDAFSFGEIRAVINHLEFSQVR